MFHLRSLTKQSLELKVLVPTILIQMFILGIFAYLLYVLTSNQVLIRRKTEEVEQIQALSSKLSVLQSNIQTSLLDFGFDRNPTHVEFITRDQREVEKTISELEKLITDETGKQLLQKFKVSRSGASLIREDFIRSVIARDEVGMQQNFSRWAIVYEDISASLQDLTNYNTKNFQRTTRVYQDALFSLYGLLIVMIIGVVILSFWMYYYMRRIIATPISRLSKMTTRIAQGDFDVQADVESDDEMGQLSRNLNWMAVRVKEYYQGLEKEIQRTRELDRRKDEFIGIASHELKTPLTSIKGYVQILERIMAEMKHEKAKYYLDKTNVYIDRLNGLISDLLDVSKIQAGKLQFNVSEFSFSDLVTESIGGIQPLSPSHKIEVKGNVRIKVKGDRNRLEQVMTNLLSNAIKYSPEAERVVVSIEKGAGELKVGVKDFGIGIGKKDQKRIFERFFRSGSVEQKFSGLGIGLYISQEIVRRHGGKMWVESEEGKGSTFYFSIPVNRATMA